MMFTESPGSGRNMLRFNYNFLSLHQNCGIPTPLPYHKTAALNVCYAASSNATENTNITPSLAYICPKVSLSGSTKAEWVNKLGG